MPPRSSWKGFIRLSLVSVPVKAFTANATSGEIRLNQLHKDCNARVKYRKVCPEHGELEGEDIVSGYEYAKNQYVVVDPDEVKKLRPKGDQSIHVHGFVDPEQLDPVCHAGRTYYLVPDGPVGQKPYQLLLDGMVAKGTHAIANVVLAGREQLVLLRPQGKLLVMTVLNHDAKINGAETFEEELVDAKFTKEELQLTKTLIEASTIEDFDYAAYKDEYVEKLTQVIQAKVDGEEIVEAPDYEEPKIINLMEALKKSVAAAQAADAVPSKKAASAKAAGKKKAPSARKSQTAKRKKSG